MHEQRSSSWRNQACANPEKRSDTAQLLARANNSFGTERGRRGPPLVEENSGTKLPTALHLELSDAACLHLWRAAWKLLAFSMPFNDNLKVCRNLRRLCFASVAACLRREKRRVMSADPLKQLTRWDMQGKRQRSHLKM